MYFVTVTSLIAVLLSYISGQRKYDFLFKIAFLLVSIIACIHYNFGTDYESYYRIYNEINNSIELKFFSIIESYGIEPLWVLLNLIFSIFGDPMGFFLMVAFLNIIQNLIYYKLISKYVKANQRWLSMLIYLFSTNFYLLNFSMMRQGFAISLVVLSIIFLLEDKYIRGVLWVIIAGFIHTSAFIFLPFLLLRLIKMKKTKIIVLILWGAFVFFLTFSSVASSMIFSFLGSELFGDYEGYSATYRGTDLGLGVVLDSVTYIAISYVLLFESKKMDYPYKVMSILVFVSFVMLPFVQYIMLLGRVTFYFSVFSIALLPKIYSCIRQKPIRLLCMFVYLFMLYYNYQEFFNPSHWAYKGFKTFHTIFEVL